MTLSKFDMDFTYQFNLRVLAQLFTVSFQCLKKLFFQKLPGLWLVGEVVNHVGIYESKATEGLSAFQRRFCFSLYEWSNYVVKNDNITAIIFKQRWVSLTCKPLKMIHTLDLQDSVVLNRIFLFCSLVLSCLVKINETVKAFGACGRINYTADNFVKWNCISKANRLRNIHGLSKSTLLL